MPALSHRDHVAPTLQAVLFDMNGTQRVDFGWYVLNGPGSLGFGVCWRWFATIGDECFVYPMCTGQDQHKRGATAIRVGSAIKQLECSRNNHASANAATRPFEYIVRVARGARIDDDRGWSPDSGLHDDTDSRVVVQLELSRRHWPSLVNARCQRFWGLRCWAALV